MLKSLLILGASARAAAQSARRAGFEPYAADIFADVDLAEICQVIQIKDYPQGLLAAAKQSPPCPWLYTGGLENHPELIDQIAAQRQLLGNAGAITRPVRNPWTLAEKLRSRGVMVLNLASVTSAPQQGRWLIKPIRSAGGRSIRPFETESRADRVSAVHSTDFYLQEFRPGVPAGAIFLGVNSRCLLLGVTKQLLGIGSLRTTQFGYRGSVGPLPISQQQQAQLMRIGSCLAEDFKLVGLFGVDVVIEGDNVWPIEVNPRYTASVEVLERAFNFNAIDLHVVCCRDQRLGAVSDSCARSVGKEIVYAQRDVVIDQAFLDRAAAKNRDCIWPQVADIPKAGTSIRAGHPVCTVFADGESIAEVEERLKQLATEFSKSANND